jgi:hypothetical protein
MENKEKYNQIIDEIFEKYGASHWTPPENPDGPLLSDQLWSLEPMQHSKETFIQACKTDKKFSARWGLKIEERELSLEERGKILEEIHPLYYMEQQLGGEDILTRNNIPTKLITVTYNNEAVEIYK